MSQIVRQSLIQATLFALMLCSVVTLSTRNLYAYDEGDTDWKFKVAPYFWFAGASGSASIGSLNSVFDLSALDMLKMADFGGMLRFEAWKGKWRFFGDVMGLLLSENGMLSSGITTDTDLGMVIFEWGLGYQVVRIPFRKEKLYPAFSFTPLAGGRFTFLDMDLKLSTGASASTTPIWVEPFVGGRINFELVEKWWISIRGDVGGFGMRGASDLTWTLVGGVHFRPWRLVSFGLLYKVYDIDYSPGQKSLKTRLQGPVINATFHL